MFLIEREEVFPGEVLSVDAKSKEELQSLLSTNRFLNVPRLSWDNMFHLCYKGVARPFKATPSLARQSPVDCLLLVSRNQAKALEVAARLCLNEKIRHKECRLGSQPVGSDNMQVLV